MPNEPPILVHGSYRHFFINQFYFHLVPLIFRVRLVKKPRILQNPPCFLTISNPEQTPLPWTFSRIIYLKSQRPLTEMTPELPTVRVHPHCKEAVYPTCWPMAVLLVVRNWRTLTIHIRWRHFPTCFPGLSESKSNGESKSTPMSFNPAYLLELIHSLHDSCWGSTRPHTTVCRVD